jgi:hypothetical protein
MQLFSLQDMMLHAQGMRCGCAGEQHRKLKRQRLRQGQGAGRWRPPSSASQVPSGATLVCCRQGSSDIRLMQRRLHGRLMQHHLPCPGRAKTLKCSDSTIARGKAKGSIHSCGTLRHIAAALAVLRALGPAAAAAHGSSGLWQNVMQGMTRPMQCSQCRAHRRIKRGAM